MAQAAAQPEDGSATLAEDEYPTISRLSAGLAEDRWDREFEDGLTAMLQRIAQFRGEPVTSVPGAEPS
jgi:hypothetical protein